MPSISIYYRFIHISFTCLLFSFSPIHTTEVTVVTKTGKSFTGIVTDSNDQYIFINAQGSQLTILKELIVSIDSGVCKNISSDTGISGVFPETEKRQLIQNNSASELPVIIIDSALYHNSFIIIASPENSKISINGKGFGTSPVKLAHVKPDTYSVEAVCDKSIKEEKIYVPDQKNTKLFLRVKRKMYAVYEVGSLTVLRTNVSITAEPRIRLGFKKDKYSYSFVGQLPQYGGRTLEDKSYAYSGGFFFDTRYEGFNFGDIFLAVPGFAIGVYDVVYQKVILTPNSATSNLRTFDKWYFLGISSTVRIGYKYIWFYIENGCFFGSSVAFSITMGLHGQI